MGWLKVGWCDWSWPAADFLWSKLKDCIFVSKRFLFFRFKVKTLRNKVYTHTRRTFFNTNLYNIQLTIYIHDASIFYVWPKKEKEKKNSMAERFRLCIAAKTTLAACFTFGLEDHKQWVHGFLLRLVWSTPYAFFASFIIVFFFVLLVKWF